MDPILRQHLATLYSRIIKHRKCWNEEFVFLSSIILTLQNHCNARYQTHTHTHTHKRSKLF